MLFGVSAMLLCVVASVVLVTLVLDVLGSGPGVGWGWVCLVLCVVRCLLWVVWGWVSCCVCLCLLESLILAQDERWRRA